ncbi:helicase-related protein [Caloramator sp. Dgby_cultured_2]|uniref:helicase-related protein n=1 Tax=Caloramator sp. Dgby_cultured_2 TaxID=3029174 RepID=UPI00237EC122|nr:helicase-related protein [Caloramator sp. Dgby_cultured_2]WDU82937.1 helicase-related protein [Caloramator sp. Dgby_cultured_2]
MFNRTTLLPDLNNKKLSTFLDEFKERIEDKSYLIVCNTISSSLDVYNNLKELNRPVFYLSTNLIPIHRRERIKNIKKLLDKGEKIILVSTQVVEAGVDVDFDVVIRDIGPLDSIIQCAGRCNRNGLKDNGLVYVYSLVPEDNDVLNFGFGKYVYGIPTLEITKKILKEPQYSEGEYFDIVSDYFKLIQQDRSKEKSKSLLIQ